MEKLKLVVDELLQIFRRKNMKIKRSKFHISQQVVFGGCTVAASAANNQVQISPSTSKVEEILGRDPPKNRKDVQSIVGSVNQLAAWVRKMNIVGNVCLIIKN